LWGEGGGADKRGADVVDDVGHFIHEEGELAELGEVRGNVDAHLELQIGDDGDEVAIADALAVAIDGALDLDCSGADAGESIGDAEAGIVVGVDADRGAEFLDDGGGDAFDFSGMEPPLVSHKTTMSAPASRAAEDGAHGVRGVFLVAVEEVLGIVEDFAAVFAQVRDGVRDHADVSSSETWKTSVTWSGHVLPTMQTAGVPASRSNWTWGPPRRRACAAGHAEGGDARVFPGTFGGFLQRRRYPLDWSRASRPRCNRCRMRRASPRHESYRAPRTRCRYPVYRP